MAQKHLVVIRTTVLTALAALITSAFPQVEVTTYHNDISRSGLNSKETILTPSNVNAEKFGLLFSLPVDGQVYAQPLYLPGVTVPGKGTHNVLFVCTEHDSVYAFDANSNVGIDAKPLWHVSFGASVPNGDVGTGDINPEIGISSTPVIYRAKSGLTLLYVVSKTKTVDSQGNPTYWQKLHALNVANGVEELRGPLVITGQVAGTGDGSTGTVVPFNPLIQHNRPGLLMVPTKGKDTSLYVMYASHGDNGPYHGWIFTIDADTLKQTSIFNTTPNALTDPSGYPLAAGGVWQGGGGPASDGTSVYFSTGNGTFNPSNGSYGDSILRMLNNTIKVADYFSPADQQTLDDDDADLGSGGVMLLPASASGTSKLNLLVQCGKEGSIYLLNTANLGGNNSADKVHQELPDVMGGVWGAPAYFNNNIYYGPVYSSLVSFPIKNGLFTTSGPAQYTSTQFQYPGPTPSISANGTKDGIVWAIQTDAYASGGPAILHAYNAADLAMELYNSSNTGNRDNLGGAVKFATPTIANGKVYAGCAGEVCVFGLGRWAAMPVISPNGGTSPGPVTVKLTDETAHAQIRYTLDGSIPTASSTLYSKPFKLSTSGTLNARAFEAGYDPGGVASANFLIAPVIGTGTGLWGQYYNGQQQNPTGPPTAGELDPSINFDWAGNSPIAGVAGSNWAGVWTGTLEAETTGIYTLTAIADDGVQVYINGNLLLNGYVYQAPTSYSGTINMVAGQTYNIQILYFQGGGGSLLQLYWAAPGLPQQIVPASQLYPSQ